MEVMSNESLPDFVGRISEEHWRARLRVAELEAVASAARTAKSVLEQVQLVWLPNSHDVKVALTALADTLNALNVRGAKEDE